MFKWEEGMNLKPKLQPFSSCITHAQIFLLNCYQGQGLYLRRLSDRRLPGSRGPASPNDRQAVEKRTSLAFLLLLLWSWFTDWRRQTSAVQQRLACSFFHGLTIGYLPGHMPWLMGKRLKSLGVTVINVLADRTCHVDRRLISGASPLAANDFGRLATKTLLEATRSKD